MSLQHRPVTRDDIPMLCSFPQGASELFYMFPKAHYPLTVAQLAEAIDQRFESTVVELNGALVGFANFYRAEPGGVCCIGNVIVAPNARGQGVASYLVRLMTRIAFERYNACEVQISCFNVNTAGLLLYPRLGFIPYGIEERRAPDGSRVALVQMACKKGREPDGGRETLA